MLGYGDILLFFSDNSLIETWYWPATDNDEDQSLKVDFSGTNRTHINIRDLRGVGYFYIFAQVCVVFFYYKTR